MVAWAFAYALCTQYPDFNKIFVSICFQLLQRGCLSKRERDDDSLPSMARIACIFAVYIVVRHSSHRSLHHAKWRIKTSHTRNKNKIIGRRDESIQAINAQMDWKFHRSTENQSNFRKPMQSKKKHCLWHTSTVWSSNYCALAFRFISAFLFSVLSFFVCVRAVLIINT